MIYSNPSDEKLCELREKLKRKGIVLDEWELLEVAREIEDSNKQEKQDGIFTLVSVQWRTKGNRYIKISIPW